MNVKPDQEPSIPIDWAAIEEESAHLLSRYIQFDTTNPPGNEAMAIEFLAGLLHERGFSPQIVQSAPGRANLIVRLESKVQPTALPCLLYAHADVVPADPANWTLPPFGGVIQDGFVWGRGALDNKGLGIIFLQALTLLKQLSFPLSRDIILLIAADEETSGKYGAAWLLDHYPHLIKAEYVWDEGGMGLQQPNRHTYYIAIAEKVPLTVNLVAQGISGHAAIPRLDNSADRLVQALFRVKQWKRPYRLTTATIEMLKTLAPDQPFPRSVLFANAGNPLLWPLLYGQLIKDPFLSPLICDTINLTVLRGGKSSNVIPAQAEAKLDVRLLPDEDPLTFLNSLRSIIADPKLLVEIEGTPPAQIPTSSQTLFYQALAETLKMIDPQGRVTPYLTPGATDSRFFRAAGMNAYGFMPMVLSDKELNRIHGVDERVSTANLRWGIQIVFETLRRL